MLNKTLPSCGSGCLCNYLGVYHRAYRRDYIINSGVVPTQSPIKPSKQIAQGLRACWSTQPTLGPAYSAIV